MRNGLKFLEMLLLTIVIVWMIRALAFTVYTIPNNCMKPELLQGDRVMVNRWSYGLRCGGDSLFRYARIIRSNIEKGDFIAFNSPLDTTSRLPDKPVIIGRVKAVPGDTIDLKGQGYVIPKSCGWCCCDPLKPYIVSLPEAERMLLVPEQNIIGRVECVIFNYNNLKFRKDRWLLRLQ